MIELDKEQDHPLNTEITKTAKSAFYPDIKATTILIFSFIGYSLISIILFGLIFNPVLFAAPPITLILYVVPLLIVIYHSLKKSRKVQGFATRIDFNKIPFLLIPMLVISTLALIIPLIQLANWIPMPDAVKNMFEKTFTKDIFSIIAVTIAAPILEEILCRGIVLKGLLKNYSPRKAIIVSAVFFAILHLNPWQAIPAMLGGLFIGWVYYKTRSIVSGIIIHATINIGSTAFLFFPVRDEQLWDIWGMPYYLLALTASVLVFISGCILINTKLTNN